MYTESGWPAAVDGFHRGVNRFRSRYSALLLTVYDDVMALTTF